MTSYECNKQIKELKEEYDKITNREYKSCTYSYAPEETPVIPEYNFKESNALLQDLVSRIGKMKHAVNKFNTSYILPGVDMTIDEALYCLAVSNQNLKRLDRMRNMQKISRTMGYKNAEFTAVNFDLTDVESAYKETHDFVVQIQTALDKANMTQEFEV